MSDKAVPDADRIVPSKSIGAGDQEKGGMPTAAQPFSSFMTKPPAAAVEHTTHISPFALMQGSIPVATTPSIDTLLGQVNKIQGTSGDIQNQLNTPHLRLKASTKYLLKNKLSEANDSLMALNTKIGAPLPAEASSSTTVGPLAKFISYMTHGQEMMDAAKQQLQNLNSKGTELSPGDFLLVQLKMNKAQQLLEFSSVLLSNAVSDIKQLMQIQI